METEERYRRNAAATAELIDAGISLMRQNIRRQNPAADESQVETLLRRWMHRADDQVPGDVAGPVRIVKTFS